MKRILKVGAVVFLSVLLFACPPGFNFNPLNITGLLFSAFVGSIHTAEMYFYYAGAKGFATTAEGFEITQAGGGTADFVFEGARPAEIDSQHSQLSTKASVTLTDFEIQGTNDDGDGVTLILDGEGYAEWLFGDEVSTDTWAYTVIIYAEGITVTGAGLDDTAAVDLLFDFQFVWDEVAATFVVTGSVVGTVNSEVIDESAWEFDFVFMP